MNKAIVILMLVVVLAVSLTACAEKEGLYSTNDSSNQGQEDTSINNMVDEDVSTTDLGNDSFIELGDMI